MKRKDRISSFFKLRPFNQGVVGSNPSRDAIKLNKGFRTVISGSLYHGVFA